MARALIRAGFDVAGLDVLPASSFGDLTPLMTDAATFAASRRIVLSVVRDVAQTEELLFDDQALITRRPSAIDTVLICSTLSPRYIAELRKRISAEIALIDAPMSGASVSAEEARLGPLGAGMTAKVLNNFCAASSTAATRTALRWAAMLGIDEDRLLAVLNDSSGQNWLASNFNRIEFARDGYTPENTLGILAKDLDSMMDALPPEEAEGLPNALLSLIRDLKPWPPG